MWLQWVSCKKVNERKIVHGKVIAGSSPAREAWLWPQTDKVVIQAYIPYQVTMMYHDSSWLQPNPGLQIQRRRDSTPCFCMCSSSTFPTVGNKLSLLLSMLRFFFRLSGCRSAAKTQHNIDFMGFHFFSTKFHAELHDHPHEEDPVIWRPLAKSQAHQNLVEFAVQDHLWIILLL